MHKSVVTEISQAGLCIGCGICAGVCPSKSLIIAKKVNGDWAPKLTRQCPPYCGLCLEVCPFYQEAIDKDSLADEKYGMIQGINKDISAGFALDAYVGYSRVDNHREQGSSGGMATWLLEELLRRNLVDRVICVCKSQSSERLFDYNIIDNIEMVRKASGSKHYPVELGSVIQDILDSTSELTYAITGLPCYLKGLQLAMRKFPKLQRQIRYELGLVCVRLPNSYYTEYLIKLSGLDTGHMAQVTYRRTEGAKRAVDFLFHAETADGESGKALPFHGRYGAIGNYRYFQFNACNYCEDVFAEVADIVFMDAWLPEYERDPAGHSLIIVRNPFLQELLMAGREEGRCFLERIPLDRVLESQEGRVDLKRREIAGRLYHSQELGFKVPATRSVPSKKIYNKGKLLIRTRYKAQEESKRLWPIYRNRPLWLFHLRMLKVIWPFQILRLRNLLKRLSGVRQLVHRFSQAVTRHSNTTSII